jgi:hypothetical protein
MLPERPQTASLDHEQLASDAQRVADLFGGAVALLHGDCAPSAVHAARATLLEARALVTSLVEHVEGQAARKAEAEREHAKAGAR